MDTVAGFVLALGLFAAAGPKDALVIRLGAGAGPLWQVTAICVAADVLLIGLGSVGLGALLATDPRLLVLLRLSGALYLLGFGAQRLACCVRDRSMPQAPSGADSAQVLRLALSLSFVNPYAWIDTVLVIGSAAAGRGAFALGASAASLAWFVALAAVSRQFGPRLLRSRHAWRALDAGIAALMTWIAAGLIRASLGGI